MAGSIVTYFSAIFLDCGPTLFCVNTSRLGSFTGLGRDAAWLTDMGAINQFDDTIARFLPVCLACAVVPCGDDQFAAHGHFAPCQKLQLPKGIRLEAERKYINAQLAGGRGAGTAGDPLFSDATGGKRTSNRLIFMP